MNRLVSIAAAAAVSALAVTASAQASIMPNSDTAAVQSLTNGRFSLLQVGLLDRHGLDYGFYQAAGSGRDAASVQQAIRSNPALTRQLQAQNVEINNVVAAIPAADGSVTFYLR